MLLQGSVGWMHAGCVLCVLVPPLSVAGKEEDEEEDKEEVGGLHPRKGRIPRTPLIVHTQLPAASLPATSPSP